MYFKFHFNLKDGVTQKVAEVEGLSKVFDGNFTNQFEQLFNEDDGGDDSSDEKVITVVQVFYFLSYRNPAL